MPAQTQVGLSEGNAFYRAQLFITLGEQRQVFLERSAERIDFALACPVDCDRLFASEANRLLLDPRGGSRNIDRLACLGFDGFTTKIVSRRKSPRLVDQHSYPGTHRV